MSAKVDYTQRKYKQVSSLTIDTEGGVVLADGETVGINRFTGSGAEPDVYVALAFAWGTGSEKIISSSRGDVDSMFDISLLDNQVTGDGVNKLQIVLINNTNVASPVVGGYFEAVKV